MMQILTVSLFLLVFSLWLAWRWKKFHYFKKLGIPGPEPSIIFGSMWELYKKNPMKCYKEWFQKYGRVVGYYFGTEPVILIADIDIIKQVLVKKFNSFTDRANPLLPLRLDHEKGHLLTGLKGQRWKEIRSLLSPSFTTAKLKSMSPLLKSSLDVLLGKIDNNSKGGHGFNIHTLYKGFTLDVTGKAVLGIESNVQDIPNHPLMKAATLLFSTPFKSLILLFGYSFREFGQAFVHAVRLKLTLENKGVNPLSKLTRTIQELVHLRRKDSSFSRPDLLQTMIDAQETVGVISDKQLEATFEDEIIEQNSDVSTRKKYSGKPSLKLSDMEITNNALLFFVAGYETTSSCLAFTTHILVNNQEVQGKLRKEIREKIYEQEEVDYNSIQKLQYMDCVIMESLRLYPPSIDFTSRQAVEDVQLGSWIFPKGSYVQIPAYALHHDPEFWPEPEKFDPDRFLPENRIPDQAMKWITFGAGPRNCIGMRFALLIIKLALANILRKFRLEPCQETQKKNSLTLRIAQNVISPKEGIFVRAVLDS